MSKPNGPESAISARAVDAVRRAMLLPRLEGELLARLQAAHWKRVAALGRLEAAQAMLAEALGELAALQAQANAALDVSLGTEHDWIVATGEIIPVSQRT